MAILRQHEMTLRQRPTPYRASFFTGAHYRNSSEGLPSGLSSPPRMLPFLKYFLKRPWQSRQMDPPQTDEMLNRQRESLPVLMTLVRSPRVKKAASSAVLPRWSHDGFLNLLLPCVCCLQDRTYALKSPHRSTNHKKRFHIKLLLLIYAFNAFPPLCEWTNHTRFVLTTNLIYPANRDVQFQIIIFTRLEESSLQVKNLVVCVCLSVITSRFWI